MKKVLFIVNFLFLFLFITSCKHKSKQDNSLFIGEWRATANDYTLIIDAGWNGTISGTRPTGSKQEKYSGKTKITEDIDGSSEYLSMGGYTKKYKARIVQRPNAFSYSSTGSPTHYEMIFSESGKTPALTFKRPM